MDPLLYRPGPIAPVVKAGENVLLVGPTGQYDLYKVAYVEPLPLSGPLVLNAGAIGAGLTVAIPAATIHAALDMDFGQVCQLRFRVLDDIIVTRFQPQAAGRGMNLNIVATINAFTALNFPHDEPSEFAIFENQVMFFNVNNPRGAANTQSRLMFHGFKYKLFGKGETTASSEGHMLPVASFMSIKDAIQSGEKFTVMPTGSAGR